MSACDADNADYVKCDTDLKDDFGTGDGTDDDECRALKKFMRCIKREVGCKSGDVVFDVLEAGCKALPQDCSNAQCRGACFAASSIVHLENNKTKRMSELQVGDKVHVGKGVYSEVYFFSTEMDDVSSKFVQISTAKASQPLL